MATLKIHNVFSQYQNQAVLKGLDLTVKKGEIVALLGPSGCGKTTLLRAIAGLQNITQGEIAINSQWVSSDNLFVPSEQRGVGMIFQDYALFPHLTVEQNILFGVKNLTKAQLQERLTEMLSLVKLEGLAQRFPHELSGGQQQRVSIARALAYEPEVLLLDEPFSNIDAKVRHAMMLEIRLILKQRNVSAVFVTHSKDEAFVFADKVALFQEGKIAQFGLAEDLYSRPHDSYVAEFLGDANYFPARVLSDVSVQTALGEVKSSKPLGLALGEERSLLIRPEQLCLSRAEPSNAVIKNRHFLGGRCHYQIEIGQQLVEAASHDMGFDVGEAVSCSVNCHELILFN